MRTNNSYFPVPAHVRQITDVISQTGFRLDTRHPAAAAFPACGEVVRPDKHLISSRTHALHVRAGGIQLSSNRREVLPIRAREGQVLLELSTHASYIASALFLSGQTDLLTYTGDRFRHMADEVNRVRTTAGVTGPLVTRSELKSALFALLEPHGSDVESERSAEVTDAMRVCWPHLWEYMRALHTTPANPAVHRHSNESSWAAIAAALEQVSDLCQPVLALHDELIVEVALDDVDDVIARAARPAQHQTGHYQPAVVVDRFVTPLAVTA